MNTTPQSPAVAAGGFDRRTFTKLTIAGLLGLLMKPEKVEFLSGDVPIVLSLNKQYSLLKPGRPRVQALPRPAIFIPGQTNLRGAVKIKVGVDREGMTASERELRYVLLLDSLTFYILRQFVTHEDVDRVTKYEPIVQQVVDELLRKHPELGPSFDKEFGFEGLDRRNLVDLCLAIIFIESMGKEDAASGTGPTGPCQISIALGIDMKLVEKKADGSIARDDRNDAKKAIPAMVQFLYQKYLAVGRHWDLAVMSYHSPVRTQELLDLAASEKDKHGRAIKWENYRDIFFCSPVSYPYLWAKVQDLSLAPNNFAASYWFRVRRTMELLWLCWEKPPEFDQLAHNQLKSTNRDDPPLADLGDEHKKKYAKYRFWTWPAWQQLPRFATHNEVVAATLKPSQVAVAVSNNQLVPLPKNLVGFNFPDVEHNGIASEHPQWRNDLSAAAPEIIGLMSLTSRQMSHLSPGSVMDVTSMVRPTEYQKDVNKKGTSLPTHEFGMAYDITQATLKPEVGIWLYALLTDFEQAELCSWMFEGTGPEGMNAVHSTVAQSDWARRWLRGYYLENPDRSK